MATITAQQIALTNRSFRKNLMTTQEWWAFLATLDVESKKVLSDIIDFRIKAERRLQNFCSSMYYRTKVRKYCNRHGYSDVYPFEVVKVISSKIVEIRAMDYILIHPAEVLGVGGFAAVHDNHSQKWDCISNPENGTTRIHLGKKGWGNGHYQMNDNPIYFYDYNF